MLGALNAIQSFAAALESISVKIYLDNVTAMAYINHGGGTRSKALTKLSTSLTAWNDQLLSFFSWRYFSLLEGSFRVSFPPIRVNFPMFGKKLEWRELM